MSHEGYILGTICRIISRSLIFYCYGNILHGAPLRLFFIHIYIFCVYFSLSRRSWCKIFNSACHRVSPKPSNPYQDGDWFKLPFHMWCTLQQHFYTTGMPKILFKYVLGKTLNGVCASLIQKHWHTWQKLRYTNTEGRYRVCLCKLGALWVNFGPVWKHDNFRARFTTTTKRLPYTIIW